MNRNVVPRWWCSSQPGTSGRSGSCEQVCCCGKVAKFCPAATVIFSCTLSKVFASRSPCRQQPSYWFSSGVHWPLSHLLSQSYSKIYVSSLVMTLPSNSDSVWRYPHSHLTFPLIILQLPEHQFCSKFLHVQIFWDNLPNTVLFNVQLIQYPLNTQLMIATHHLPYPLIYDLSYLLKTYHSWCHLSHPSAPFWTSCASQKHVCGIVFGSYICWRILRVCDHRFH